MTGPATLNHLSPAAPISPPPPWAGEKRINPVFPVIGGPVPLFSREVPDGPTLH